MEVALSIAILAAANLIHRILLLPSTPMSFDSWGHLYFAVEAKRARSGPFGGLYPRVAGGEAFYYPLFVHWLYGFLPNGLLRRHTALINPVLESLFLAGFLALAAAASLDLDLIRLAGAAYILTPLWFSKAAFGPRVLAFTTRLVSEVAYPLALAITLFDLRLSPLVTIPLSAVLIAGILLGSKFGVQNVFLVTPLTAILAGSWVLAAGGILGLALAWIASGGAFGKQLHQQGKHLAWYFGELRAGRAMVLGRNSIWHLIPRSLRPSGMEFKKIAFGWLGRNSFTAVLIKAPHLVLIPFLVIDFSSSLHLPRALWAPTAAAALVYLLINIPWLLFLGEAERYLSHVSIFTNLLFATICLQTGLVGLAIVLGVYGLLFSLGERLALREPLHPQRERDADAAIAYLRQRSDRRMVLSIPFGALAPYRILLDTEHGAVFSLIAGREHQRAMKGLETDLHVDLGQWERVTEVTGADLLVIRAPALPEQFHDWRPPDGWTRIAGDFGELMLYERPA